MAAIAARPVSPTFVASQRDRVTVWLHTSRWVPASSSRATSGAPQKTPMIPGRASTAAEPRKYMVPLLPPLASRSSRVLPLVSERSASCAPVTARTAASTASAP